MTRRTEIVHITADNRDKGRTYIITEMDAFEGEDLGVKILLALANAGVDVGDTSRGLAGLAAVGIAAMAKLPYVVVKPILNDMLKYVVYQHAPKHPTMPIGTDNVWETSTLIEIRKGFIKLHLGFLKAGDTQTTAPSSNVPQPTSPA